MFPIEDVRTAPTDHPPMIVGALMRGGDFVKAPEWVATLIDLIGSGHIHARAGRTSHGIDLMLQPGSPPEEPINRVFYDAIVGWLPTTLGQFADTIRMGEASKTFAQWWSRWVRAVEHAVREYGWVKTSKWRSLVPGVTFNDEAHALAERWGSYALAMGHTATDHGTARYLANALVLGKAEAALAQRGDSPVFHLAWDTSKDVQQRLRLVALITWVGRVYEFAGTSSLVPGGSSGRIVAGAVLAQDTFAGCGGFTTT